MQNDATLVSPVALPSHSAITGVYASVNLADAYAVPLPPQASRDPHVLARFIFSNQPAWVGRLMKIRDAIVAGFGLKTSKRLARRTDDGRRVSFFKVYSVGPTEIVLGEDDRHLDFRLSLLCAGEDGPRGALTLTLSTVVHCHNALGRIYLCVIAPFHRWIVKASLRRAARLGWPGTAA